MGRERRPWGIVAGPVILVLGLGVFWGAKSAVAVKDQVEDWAYRFDHSSEPVHMEMPNIPLIPPLYVNGNRIGRIETVVIQRTRPASIDSVTIVASVDAHHAVGLEACNLRLRVRNLDEHSLTRALRCTRDIENLQPFGHLEIEGSDRIVPILVRVGDLPCEERGVHVGPCDEISGDLRRELRELERDLAIQADQIRIELKESNGDVQADLEQAREDLRRAREEVRTKVRAVIR